MRVVRTQCRSRRSTSSRSRCSTRSEPSPAQWWRPTVVHTKTCRLRCEPVLSTHPMVASFAAVELSFAFFADSAVVPPDGKLYVLGGEFSTLALVQLPGRANFAVVAGFRFGPADVSQTRSVELRFVDADGKLVLPAASLQFQSAGGQLPIGQEVSVSTVTFLQPMFGEPGTY